MLSVSAILLVLSVVGVGILHTMVPDHWLPIALLARQRGWTPSETARAAAQAGFGHVVTTLLLGVAVWAIGAAASQRFGQAVDAAASAALVAFGLWIALGAWREMRQSQPDGHDHSHHDGHAHHGGHGDHAHGHRHDHPGPWQRDALYAAVATGQRAERHVHWHRHGSGQPHTHWHDHDSVSTHMIGADAAATAPAHIHRHGTSGRTALLLVLGSSPMVEGIPAFFAASRFGVALIVVMAVAFALSTIATYVVLSVYSAAGLQRFRLGPLERYGEVASGLLIAVVGLIFGAVSLL